MKSVISFLLLVLLLGRPVLAQEADPSQLGVHEAIELAESRSPLLNQLRQEIRAKGGEWWTSFGLQAPVLLYTREGVGSGAFDEQRWTLSQTVDFPLQSYYRLRRVDTEQNALQLNLSAQQSIVKAEVKKAYTDLLYAQEILHLRQEEVHLASELEQAARVRVEVGEASELEVMKAELGRAEGQSALEEAQRQFQNARYALFNVIGLDPDEQRYGLTFPDTLVYVDVDIDQEAVLARLPVQPELQSAQRGVEAARTGIRETRSRLLPALQFDAYPQDFGGGYNRFGFQVGIRIPLWVVPNHRGDMQQARAAVQQQVWQEEAARLDLKKQIEQAWHGYETSRETIDRYHTAVRARADELMRLTREGYLIGELDLLTLLDTQRTYLASQQRYYDALREYYFQLIDLERFLGEDLVYDSDSAPEYAVGQ